MNIETRLDQQRGCGWRKPGGLYMVAGGLSAPCGLLPIPLTVCPTCSCGIKPTRGWTWVDVKALVAGKGCSLPAGRCLVCPLGVNNLGGKQGLLWVGGQFYERPIDWTAEAIKQGVSRRISAVPKDFKIGETWVLVAHREAITVREAIILDGERKDAEYQAAIFHAFKPSAIEYVVKGDETEDDLERLAKRGITPVQVVRIGEQQELEADQEEDEVFAE